MKTFKIDRNKFIELYCRWVTDWNGDEVLSLKEKYNKDCIFWENGCSVYNERPLQCINFPFWASIVSSEVNWKSAGVECPGINTGKLHTKKTIDGLLQLRSIFPIISKKR
jgi:Fe-S-cluster containining protein